MKWGTFISIIIVCARAYAASISGTAVALCGADGFGASCSETYSQNKCAVGYFDEAKAQRNTFMAPINGDCRENGYSYIGVPDELEFIYNGFIIGTAVALCGADEHVVDGVCTAYFRDDCPAGWVNITDYDTTFMPMSLGVCASGYTKRSFSQQCNKLKNDDACMAVCGGDLFWSDIGVCDTLCMFGGTSFNIKKTNADILSFPIYSTHQITPSIAFGIGDGVCYVNLMPGAGNDAVNLQYNNTTYHTVK